MNLRRAVIVLTSLLLIALLLAGNIAPLIPAVNASEEEITVVDLQSTWRYLDNGTDPSSASDRTSWTEINFDDSSWKVNSGNATFGAKSGKLQALDEEGVFLPKVLLTHYMSDGYCVPTYFFRTTVNLSFAPQGGYALIGSLYYDDSAIVYVNGTPVAFFDVPEGGFESNLSYGGSGDYNPRLGTFTADASLLRAGENVIAVEVHNQRNNSSDVYFEMTQITMKSFKFDYLNMTVGEDRSKRNFTWYFNSSVGAVQYAPCTGDSFPQTYATASSSATAHGNTYIHRATITGLQPDTKYAYRVVCGNLISKTFYFETDPADSFNFIYVGDPQLGGSWGGQDDTAEWAKTLTLAEEMFPNTSLLVSGGDQVEVYNSEKQYAAFMAPEVLTQLALAPSIGNHDTKGVLYSQHFNNPNTDINGTAYGLTEAGGDYWYTYNNTLFMHLNINNENVDEHKTFMKYAVSQAGNAKWRIVVMHFPMYGAGPYYTHDNITAIRNAIVPIFDELDIDVVLSGHEHVYSRSYMIRKTDSGYAPDRSRGVLSSITNPVGILFVSGCTSTGSKYYDMMTDPNTTHVAIKAHHITTFSNVEVTDTAFTITTYNTADRSVVDCFSIVKDENLYSDDTASKIGNNIALGKSYTTSMLYRQGGADVNWAYDPNAEITYPDKNQSELTDGYIPTDNDYKNPAWLGLHYKSPDAQEMKYVFARVDLEDKYDVTKVTLYLPSSDFSRDNGVYGPDGDKVTFYADGRQIDGNVTITAVNSYVSAYTITADVKAQEIEVRVNHGAWTFMSELAVEGTLSSQEEYADGDINADGSVDVFDYMLVKMHYFKTYTLTDDEYLRANIVEDEYIDVFDYMAVKSIVLNS